MSKASSSVSAGQDNIAFQEDCCECYVQDFMDPPDDCCWVTKSHSNLTEDPAVDFDQFKQYVESCDDKLYKTNSKTRLGLSVPLDVHTFVEFVELDVESKVDQFETDLYGGIKVVQATTVGGKQLPVGASGMRDPFHTNQFSLVRFMWQSKEVFYYADCGSVLRKTGFKYVHHPVMDGNCSAEAVLMACYQRPERWKCVSAFVKPAIDLLPPNLDEFRTELNEVLHRASAKRLTISSAPGIPRTTYFWTNGSMWTLASFLLIRHRL